MKDFDLAYQTLEIEEAICTVHEQSFTKRPQLKERKKDMNTSQHQSQL